MDNLDSSLSGRGNGRTSRAQSRSSGRTSPGVECERRNLFAWPFFAGPGSALAWALAQGRTGFPFRNEHSLDPRVRTRDAGNQDLEWAVNHGRMRGSLEAPKRAVTEREP